MSTVLGLQLEKTTIISFLIKHLGAFYPKCSKCADKNISAN